MPASFGVSLGSISLQLLTFPDTFWEPNWLTVVHVGVDGTTSRK
jgi:hypothetical protein